MEEWPVVEWLVVGWQEEGWPAEEWLVVEWPEEELLVEEWLEEEWPGEEWRVVERRLEEETERLEEERRPEGWRREPAAAVWWPEGKRWEWLGWEVQEWWSEKSPDLERRLRPRRRRGVPRTARPYDDPSWL